MPALFLFFFFLVDKNEHTWWKILYQKSFLDVNKSKQWMKTKTIVDIPEVHMQNDCKLAWHLPYPEQKKTRKSEECVQKDTQTHPCRHKQEYKHTCTRRHLFTRTRAHAWTRSRITRARTHTHTHTHAHARAHAHKHMHTFAHTHERTYASTHPHRQRHTPMHTHTHTHTHTHAHTQTHYHVFVNLFEKVTILLDHVNFLEEWQQKVLCNSTNTCSTIWKKKKKREKKWA